MLLCVFLFLSIAAFAQTGAGGHKGHHEEDYKMTEMPPPPRMTGVGDSHLKITTKSDAAQAYFDQGLSLLHCFWDFEAHRAFQESARLDPDAAMAYWGIVESINDYKAMSEEKKAALEKAKKLMPKVSDHEKYYLRAQQAAQEEDGHDEWRREMEELVDQFPDDIDAKLFLAIKSNAGYNAEGKPLKDNIYARMLLRDVLRDHPNSAAAHHYMIHVLESGPHAGDARTDADALSRLAPNSGHMVHMPGHIYYKLGDYERARKSFLDSLHVDEAYLRSEKVSSIDDWNYPHNLSYLIASDAESGRLKEAMEMARRLEQLPANPFLAKGRPAHAMTVGGAEMRLNTRYGRWQAILDKPIDLGMDASVAGPAAVAYRDGMIAYAKGMLALTRKNFDLAERQSDALDAISWRLHAASDDEKDRPKNVLRMLEMVSLDLRGNLSSERGKSAEAIELLKKAIEKEKEIGYQEPPQYGRPESESLGYAYIRAGQYEKAREAFRDALKLRPNSGHALYGVAQSFESAGDKQAAAKAYSEFLNVWRTADPDLPMVKHAQASSH